MDFNDKTELTRSVGTSQLIDIDPTKKSDRSEVAFLHYDAIHNALNGFHFEFSVSLPPLLPLCPRR